MVRPIPPLPVERLTPNQDLAIIACRRGGSASTPTLQRTFGVRWASRPDLGFPVSGYSVERIQPDGSAVPLKPSGATFKLPETGNWAQFKQEIEDRRPPAGPYFPAADILEENFGHLMPLIRLVDPRTSSGDLPHLIPEVADFLGHPHEGDAALTLALWPGGIAPPLAALLGSPTSEALLIAYYERQAIGFLLALALRFEYGVLFGLAADDFVEKSIPMIYRVSARWKTVSGSADSAEVQTNATCDPSRPDWFRAERIPGSVAHPAFNVFAGWKPPEELLAKDSMGNRQAPESVIPRAPSAISALSWAGPSPSDRLIDHQPVLYELTRFDHGAATAGQQVPPPDPPLATYKPVLRGELLLRPDTEPHALDRPGQAWPPMAGYYHYQLRGVDLLGAKSSHAAITSIRHHDDLAPPGPGLEISDPRILAFEPGQTSRDIAFRLHWRAAQDFVGPDANEFRIALRWLPRDGIAVRILEVSAVPGSLFDGEATVDPLPGNPDQYRGLHLSLPDGDFPIVGHSSGPGARIRLRRVDGRLPAAGQDGFIFAPGVEGPRTRIARLPRRPSVPLWVSSVPTTNPLVIELTAAGALEPPAGDFFLYLHVLRTTLRATRQAPGRWIIPRPGDNDPRAEAWDAWLSLPDPGVILTDSPAIAFPDHEGTIRVDLPAGFGGGLLMIDATAADSADYVASPPWATSRPALAGLTGNESDPVTATLSVRVLTQPPAPTVTPWDPAKILWARSASLFAEEAHFDLSWTTVAGAAHYEVWRVLEGALAGVSATTSDAALRSLSREQPAAFGLRSLKIFGGRYRDELPGRAPTRALYKIRAVSLSGVPGAWSDLIGPVQVPDIRRPPAPNLLRAAVPPPNPVLPNSDERRIVLEWTQAGPRDDLRFDAELRAPGAGPWQVVASKPRGALPEPGPAGIYRLQVEGLVPGQDREFRVRAVREARDPIDPLGHLRREIAGATSEVRRARATGRVRPPDGVGAKPIAGGQVELSWVNRDQYRAIEVLRQQPGSHHFRRVTQLDSTLERYRDSGLAPGRWRYRLRAIGNSRSAESGETEVDVT